MGSGTTGVAVVKLNMENPERLFKFIGIELEKEYFGIAVKRIKYHAKN
jgi:DNA modification methylase